MAFSWAGDLSGSVAPVIRNFQIGATLYQGQLLGYDTSGATNGGYVIPTADAGAGPDTTSFIVGICTGIIQDARAFNSTYKGDSLAYSTTQSTLAGYSPADAVMAQVSLVTPTTLIKGPLVKDTIGTACETVTNTVASSGGTTVTFTTIDTTVDGLSTMYCRSGANRGLYRKVTTAGTTSSVAVIPFPNAIAVGDVFCIVNMVLGAARIQLDTQFQGIDSSADLSHYYKVFCFAMNLEKAGEENATFTISTDHLVIGKGV
jgi:hypothetical protein